MLYDADAVRKLASFIVSQSRLNEDKLVFVEKDIWLSLILKYLHALPSAKERLVFKGGTCLVKCYFGYYRFSEDLDFTWVGLKASKKGKRRAWEREFVEPLKLNFGFGVEETEVIRGGVRHSHSGKILNYFLLAPPASGRSELKLKITVSFDERVSFPLSRRLVNPVKLKEKSLADALALFGGVAEAYFSLFDVLCYSAPEIVCEKMRAVLTRREKLNRSRDVVDLLHLSKVVDLRKSVVCPACVSKISRSVAVKAWGDIFKARRAGLAQYLSNVVAYAFNEPVYVEALNRTELNDFVEKELEPVLVDLIKSLDAEAKL